MSKIELFSNLLRLFLYISSNYLFMCFALFSIGLLGCSPQFLRGHFILQKLAFYLWYILQPFSPICLLILLMVFFFQAKFKFFYLIKFINLFFYCLWILIQVRNSFSTSRNTPTFSSVLAEFIFFIYLSDPFQSMFLSAAGNRSPSLLNGYPLVLAPLVKKIVWTPVLSNATFIFKIF